MRGDDAAHAASARSVAELQYRTWGLLALIRSVVRRTARSSETVEEYVMHLEGRLGAIGRGQEISLWDQDRATDLEYLLAEEFLAHAAREEQQVTLSGPPIELRNRATMLLGLTFHELIVNAVKYGALSDRAGRIAVDWHIGPVSGPGQPCLLQLRWKETVAGRVAREAPRRGFGAELIERMLPYELHAETSLDLDEDGLRCSISLPLSADIAPSERAAPRQDAP